jgi:hypothetical protein
MNYQSVWMQPVKELKRIINFVLETKAYGIHIEPQFTKDKWTLFTKDNWTLSIYTNSDWAGGRIYNLLDEHSDFFGNRRRKRHLHCRVQKQSIMSWQKQQRDLVYCSSIGIIEY